MMERSALIIIDGLSPQDRRGIQSADQLSDSPQLQGLAQADALTEEEACAALRVGPIFQMLLEGEVDEVLLVIPKAEFGIRHQTNVEQAAIRAGG